MGNQYAGEIVFYLKPNIPQIIISDLEHVVDSVSLDIDEPYFSNQFVASQILQHSDWKYGHYELAKLVQLEEEKDEELTKCYEFMQLYYKNHEYDDSFLHIDGESHNIDQLKGYMFRCHFASKQYIDEQKRDLGRLWYNFLIPHIDQEKYLDKYMGFVKDEDCRYIQYFTFYPEELNRDWNEFYFREI